MCLVDQDESTVREAVSELNLDASHWDLSPLLAIDSFAGDRLAFAVELINDSDSASPDPPIIIESIAERLDVKRTFFAAVEREFSEHAVLCSNTSTLRIADIAAGLSRPEKFCGMHFFMPVDQRSAVEVVRGERTSAATIEIVNCHVRRIAKQPMVVGDGPGFIVNRLLSPYLNEAMLLLGRGVGAAQIQRTALAYGMPMSPLELIDWIGTRTIFDAGRVFWQAFPSRIDPSPIAPAMLKRRRFGRASQAGFYDYVGGIRSAELSAETIEVVAMYRRDEVELEDQQVMEILAIPMFIEAALACQDGTAQSLQQCEIAMTGGLGFDPEKSWLGFFEALGSQRILDCCERWSASSASLSLPSWIAQRLRSGSPGEITSQRSRQNRR